VENVHSEWGGETRGEGAGEGEEISRSIRGWMNKIQRKDDKFVKISTDVIHLRPIGMIFHFEYIDKFNVRNLN
jgi:hypothetical protein